MNSSKQGVLTSHAVFGGVHMAPVRLDHGMQFEKNGRSVLSDATPVLQNKN
jgi:hypothetical protein